MLADKPSEEALARYVKDFPELGISESSILRHFDKSYRLPSAIVAKKEVAAALEKKYPGMAGRGSAKSDPLLRQKEFPTNYPQDAVDILKAMSFNDGKGLNIVGSMSMRSQDWAGDYDGYQVATVKERSDAAAAKAFAGQWAANIKKLRAMKDVYIGDIKCGTVEEWRVIPRTARVVDGKVLDYNAVACRKRLDELKAKGVISPAEAKDAAELCKPSPSIPEFLLAKQKVKFHIVRWTPDEIIRGRKRLRDNSIMTLTQAIQTPTIGKMDCVGLVQNSRFTDFSVIYEFRNGDKLLNPDKINITESLREAIMAYSAEGNYFKVLKRRYALAKAENDLAMVRKLTPILNSDLGRLYHVVGDIGTLTNLLEMPRVPMAKVRFEIDQFIGRLSGIWTMKDYLAAEPEIIGRIHAILKMSKSKMVDALDRLGNQLEGYLQHATKAVVQKAGLPLKGGAEMEGGGGLTDYYRSLSEAERRARRAAISGRMAELRNEIARLEAVVAAAPRIPAASPFARAPSALRIEAEKATSRLGALREELAEAEHHMRALQSVMKGGARRPTAEYVKRIKEEPLETAATIRAKAAARARETRDRKMRELSKPGKSAEEALREVAERMRARAVERARKAVPKGGPKGRGRTGGAKPGELRRMAAVRRMAAIEREIDSALHHISRLSRRLLGMPEGPEKNALRMEIHHQHAARVEPLEREAAALVAIIRASPRGLEGNGFWDSISSFLSGLFGRKKEEPKAAAAAPAADPVEEAKKALAPLGISSRKEFNKWALRNHPDKGGDTAQFQRVSSLADKAFKGGRRRRVPVASK